MKMYIYILFLLLPLFIFSQNNITGIEDVFHQVSAGAANFGLVPVENSSEGVVRWILYDSV